MLWCGARHGGHCGCIAGEHEVRPYGAGHGRIAGEHKVRPYGMAVVVCCGALGFIAGEHEVRPYRMDTAWVRHSCWCSRLLRAHVELPAPILAGAERGRCAAREHELVVQVAEWEPGERRNA